MGPAIYNGKHHASYKYGFPFKSPGKTAEVRGANATRDVMLGSDTEKWYAVTAPPLSEVGGSHVNRAD
jgi:hypothetical protein